MRNSYVILPQSHCLYSINCEKLFLLPEHWAFRIFAFWP